TLIHPAILEAIGAAGHGARILVADGNYPASTKCGDNSALVYLNLTPGSPTVTEVLDALLTAIPVEAASVMVPDEGPEPPVFSEFRTRLAGVELSPCGRFEFYAEAGSADTCLTIITGEQRIYANLLLTIGVRLG
ncbi:MAG: RbsD/FucU family protein, partial [Candidatus Hydrogenedentes bacterium]|nr:RbsD/FucU family protein [Candidatus Hydrogenedentota bacterium]